MCAPLLHGKNYEKKALKQFEMAHDVKTKECGFFIYKEKPFLGATPDAVIDNECIVEVKCPYKGRHEKISPGRNFPYLELNEEGKVALKRSSRYYDQIQGQLLISRRKYCYFVVYTFKDLLVETVEFDEHYCKFSLIPKLESFYVSHYRPFLAGKL